MALTLTVFRVFPDKDSLLRAVLDNRPFMMMVGFKLLQFLALSASGATTAFFVVMVLKHDLALMSMLAPRFSSSILSVSLAALWLSTSLTTT